MPPRTQQTPRTNRNPNRPSRTPRPQNRRVVTPSGTRTETVLVPQTGGNVDKVRILAFPIRERMTILDEVILDFTWSEDALTSASVQADITVKNIGDFAKDVLKPGTWLQPQYLDPFTESWHNLDPQLYVWERSRTDRVQQTASVTAFDILSFVARQDEANWLFKRDKKHKGGWFAHQIAKTILFELEIQSKLVIGKYKIPYLYLQNHNPFEVILKAYTRDRQISNIRYRVQARGRKFTVLPYTKQDRTWVISDDSNLIESEWRESLDGLKTEVVVISATAGQNGEIINAGARAISPKVREYGRIRDVVYLDRNVRPEVLKVFAREALKYVSKTTDEIRIRAQGLIPMRAADAVFIEDKGTGLSGRFFVKNITHNVSSGTHIMDIELSRAAIVPTLFPSRDELVKSTGSAIIGVKSTEGPLGVAWFPPLGAKKFRVTQGSAPARGPGRSAP